MGKKGWGGSGAEWRGRRGVRKDRLERGDDVSDNERERARERSLEFGQIDGRLVVVRVRAQIDDALVDARQRRHKAFARHRQHRVGLESRRDLLPFGEIGEFIVDRLDQAAQLALIRQKLLAGGMQLIRLVRYALVFRLETREVGQRVRDG